MSDVFVFWMIVVCMMVVVDCWICLYVDDCVDGSGRWIVLYYVFEYGDWVLVFVVDYEGVVIVVEEYCYGVGIVVFGIIGGGVE